MKKRNRMLMICLTVILLFSLTGCSFTDSLKLLFGTTEETQLTLEEIQEKKDAKVIRTVDESLDKPVFDIDLGGEIEYQVGTGAEALTVEANVTNGTVTYQWYYNDAESNGGGTAIDGATETTYIPSTSETGTTYYYCVATNTVNGKVRMSTSSVVAIVVEDIEEMEVLEAEETEETGSSAVSETEETSE